MLQTEIAQQGATRTTWPAAVVCHNCHIWRILLMRNDFLCPLDLVSAMTIDISLYVIKAKCVIIQKLEVMTGLCNYV